MQTSCSIFACMVEACPRTDITKIEYYGKKFTVQEVIDYSLLVGGYLCANGYAGGSVGVMLPNIPEAVFTLYGCSASGSVANLINPRIPTKKLKSLLLSTDTKVLFLYDALYPKHKDMLSSLGVKVVLCSPFYYRSDLKWLYALKSVGNRKNYFENVLTSGKCTPLSTDGKEAVAYIHSGGTTGEPKTVVLSSYALNSLAEAILTTVHPKKTYDAERDSMLMMLPIFHGFGLGVCAHTIACACRIVLEPRFLPSESVKMIKKYSVTHLAGVPAMYRKMLGVKALRDGRLRNVTNVFCGGDSLSSLVKERFDEALKSAGSTAEMVEGYGLSETASVVTVGRVGATKEHSQGQALKGNEIRIYKGATPLSAGEVGEILVSTPSLMSGYLGESQSDVVVDIDGKPFLKTGDLGYMDSDGYLFYLERQKRSIKIGAINIFPQEIERVCRELSEVVECCVARCYDKNNKPYVKLHLQLEDGIELNSLLESKIKRKIEQEIVRYAVPKEFCLEKEIKRTEMGKIDFNYYESLN
ncbi:MAG: acyl--CoA ligase [Clostridia bacterium]|nr:acyl--CoA ligase [Clostridia bacterium]